jgi:hypothetical protein
VEDEESLKTSALFRQLADPVQDKVDDLLANGVVATSVVVGSVLLSSDQLLRVEKLAVGSHPDLIDDSGFQINKDSPGDMLATASLGKESVEGIISASKGLVRWHLAIRLDSMLKAVELPAGVTNLATGLTNVDRDALTHFG